MAIASCTVSLFISIAVDCGPLPQILNGQVDVKTTMFGSTATYKCDHGYKLTSGEESSYERTCQSDKTWSGTVPTCQCKLWHCLC